MSKTSFAETKRGSLIRACIMGRATAEQIAYYRRSLMSAEEVILGKPVFEMNAQEFREYTVFCENMKYGDLEGGKCPKCRNKGLIYSLDESGNEYAEECTCMAARRNNAALQDSEYSALLRKSTFGRYRLDHPWQRTALCVCRDWLRQRRFPFLYLGGRTGAGKTHLAVATFADRVRMGKRGIFVNWRTESEWLKFNKKAPDYERRLNNLKRAPLLLLDDFLWRKSSIPTEEDFALAKEVLDARLYNGRPTIFTGTYTMHELFSLSEELCGRINEGTGGEKRFALDFGAETANMRMEDLFDAEDCPFGEEVNA